MRKETLTFKVDSKLIEELGRRLVGKPYMALAELVKNSYDADARKVTIEVDNANDRIIVTDDGHGMTFNEFKNFWMRIGSTHKQEQRVSRNFSRPMTGSKGIGRLAVQLLAKEMTLVSLAEGIPKEELTAEVRWQKILESEFANEAKLLCKIDEPSVLGKHGTRITLSGLENKWDEDEVRRLAQEIWFLRPPFDLEPAKTRDERAKYDFEVELVSPVKSLVKIFESQMDSIFDVWNARIDGVSKNGEVALTLRFKGDEQTIRHQYSISGCRLKNANFQIRIFDFTRRQPKGIRVEEARAYMRTWGGVHVYDSGFRLAYYGVPENDWLRIEIDHARRISNSQLLPKGLQIDKGMTNLPTLSRIFGIVNVDTSREDDLEISVTRDRFRETKALDDLVGIVRWALDFYAMKSTVRGLKTGHEGKKRRKRISKSVKQLKKVVESARGSIPSPAYKEIKAHLRDISKDLQDEGKEAQVRLGALGSLATAGIAARAFDHELEKLLPDMESMIKRLKNITISESAEAGRIAKIVSTMEKWLVRARGTYALFGPIKDAENVTTRQVFKASALVGQVESQLEDLAHGLKISQDRLDKNLDLPPGSFAEWCSIFQNLFINAYDAMAESSRIEIDVSSRRLNARTEILIQDYGSGVDLRQSEKYFEPFVRKMPLSPEKRALGLGGSGLGLTIVRMIADSIECKVRFTKPESGFSTAISISWE